MPQPLLFTLNRISHTDVQALQLGIRAKPLLQPAFMRQRPRSVQLSLAPDVPINRPWSSTSSRVTSDIVSPFQPSVVHQLLPYPPTYFRLTGTTKDSTGAALGSCTVDWFNTADDVRIDTTTSDANGLFEFRTAGQPPNAYYLVAYKAGTTDVAGVTVNTLTGL